MKTIAQILAITSCLLFVTSCGTQDNGPLGPGPGTDPPDPQPNPDGVLLEGGDSDPARGALVPLPPSPVDPSEILEGLLTTRLIGLIDPQATVAEVNTALESQGARLVTMSADNPFVTIKIPAAGDREAALSTAAALLASGAFTYVGPAYGVNVDEPIPAPTKAPGEPGRSGTDIAAEAPDHLRLSRMLPAWNVRELALANQERITVLVPDEYASLAPHFEIDAQFMTGFGAALSLPGPDIYPGNNGFVVAGVVGANVDETLPTGTSPDPVELLDIRSMPLGGLTWNDVFWMLAWEIAGGGDRFVLNTGISYNDPAFLNYSRLDRAMHVIAWRVAAALHYDEFVHVTAAGRNDGDPQTNSPFIAAAAFGDVRDMVDLDALSPEDRQSIEDAWSDLNAALAPATVAAPNVLIVASADMSGDLSSFSAPGNVRALGEQIVGPCVSQDPAYSPGYLCDGEVAVYGGAGVAAAQVSGLAAYMMSLRDVSPARVRQIILDSYSTSITGWVDAFGAVLALDGPDQHPVRETLLDVAGFESDDSDGRFDQYDLEALTSLTSGVGTKVAPTDVYPASYRRDFNGDFVVGGFDTARFDLNNDGDYSVVTQNIEGNSISFDENAVTDFQIVCYYAYSDVYRGDLTERAQYVVPGHSGLSVQIEGVPDRVDAGETADIVVTVTATVEGGDPTFVEGIDITLELDGAEAVSSSGVTNSAGVFETTITFGDEDNEMVVGAWAESESDEVYTEKKARRENYVELVERSVFISAGVFASYNEEGLAGVRPIEEYLFEDFTHFDPIDMNLARTGSATAQGMDISGSASIDVTTRVEQSTGGYFDGTSVVVRSTASISLLNPNYDLLTYHAQSEAEADVVVEFIVWGDPARYNMDGVTGRKEYDVELEGPDGDIYECDSNDDPCDTVSSAGELAPGDYRLSVYHANGGYIRWVQECTDCNASGVETWDGSLNVDFEINHND